MSSMRFVVWVGLLALLCAAVTEAKDTDGKPQGSVRKLTRTISKAFNVGGKSHKQATREAPSLIRQKTQASLHAGDTSDSDKGDTSGSDKSGGAGTLKRTSTVKNLWGTLRGTRSHKPRPTAQSAVEPIFSKLMSDESGEIPPFLLAAWHAILLPERHGLLVQGIFRESGKHDHVLEMQKAIDEQRMITPEEYAPYDVKTIAVVLKQFLNSQTTDDGLKGLLGGYKAIFEGKTDYEPNLDEILEKTHIGGPSQRAKVGRFYIKIARTVAKYAKANLMHEENMALVYPGFMQLDVSNPLDTPNLYTNVRKVVLKLIEELDHVEAAPDTVPYPVPV